MKPVFQQPMDGKCVQACVASILGLRMDQVPNLNCEGHIYDAEKKHFICTVPGHSREYESNGEKRITYDCDNAYEQRKRIKDFVARFGFLCSDMRMEDSHREVGPTQHSNYRILPAGICIATGPSPRFAGHHAVVWDTRLVDFEHPYGRMVHDPAPQPPGERAGIGMVAEFLFLELADTDKLEELVKLQKENPLPTALNDSSTSAEIRMN